MRPSLRSTFVITALVLQLMSAHCDRVLRVWTQYDKQYALLKAVSENDVFWEHVFKQSVYLNLANVRFRRIVDNELLNGAVVHLHETADGAESDSKPVSPEALLNNVMVSGRRKIGTVVDMTVDVLKTAFTCLAYKDAVLLMTLFRAEITRDIDERRLTKRAKMAKAAVATVLMKMGAMQFTDQLLMKAVRFFTVFGNEEQMATIKRYTFLPFSDRLVDEMMGYVKESCANPAATLSDIAKELEFDWDESLFDKPESISVEVFKNMFYSSVGIFGQHYEKLGIDTDMSTDAWKDILRFQPTGNKTTRRQDRTLMNFLKGLSL